MVQGNDFDDRNAQGEESPFSADLGGDFGASFGAGSGSGSGFKEGGRKTRLIILLGIFFVLLGVAGYFYFYEDDGLSDADFSLSSDEAQDEALGKKADEKDEKDEKKEAVKDSLGPDGQQAQHTSPKTPGLAPTELAATKGEYPLNAQAGAGARSEFLVGSEEAAPRSEWARETASDREVQASTAPTLTSPADGYTRIYDETSEPAVFQWEGGGGWILFARDAGMTTVKVRRQVRGSSTEVRKLYPGTWYWQVRNSAGSSEVRSFHVQQPQQRALTLLQPAAGGILAGNGGVVAWTGDTKVSYYRVELSTGGGWANPLYRFASSGTQLVLQDVSAGQYQLRLGAFSEVSGRWEYLPALAVTIQ